MAWTLHQSHQVTQSQLMMKLFCFLRICAQSEAWGLFCYFVWTSVLPALILIKRFQNVQADKILSVAAKKVQQHDSKFSYCGVFSSYRTLVRPSFKVTYKQVTSLEWRCCPGFVGEECREGELIICTFLKAPYYTDYQSFIFHPSWAAS